MSLIQHILSELLNYVCFLIRRRFKIKQILLLKIGNVENQWSFIGPFGIKPGLKLLDLLLGYIHHKSFISLFTEQRFTVLNVNSVFLVFVEKILRLEPVHAQKFYDAIHKWHLSGDLLDFFFMLFDLCRILLMSHRQLL
jgi:hypothetical protein